MILALALAAAQPGDVVGEMIARSRATLPKVSAVECLPSDDPDEIVVCGRRAGERSPHRLPLPVEPEPGAPVRGDIGTGTAALAETERCLRLCNVGVSVDVIGAINAVGKGIDILVNGE